MPQMSSVSGGFMKKRCAYREAHLTKQEKRCMLKKLLRQLLNLARPARTMRRCSVPARAQSIPCTHSGEEKEAAS